MDVDPKKPGSFAPLWATIGAVNQVDQHIGCSPRSVKLVAKKHIFLILPDRDASVGMKSGKAVRILPCSLNSHDNMRRWHAGEKVAENAVALSWTPSSGKTRATKGRVKVEAKAIEEDDWCTLWIMTSDEFEAGTVSFCCWEKEYRKYYIRHNNDNINACIEEVGSSGFKQAASFNLLLRSDCDPRMNRNGSSVMNISIDPSVLEEHLRSDKSRVEAQEVGQDSSTDGRSESGILHDSSIPSRGSVSSGAERGEFEEEETDVKRTRDLRSARQKVKKKDGTHSNTDSDHRGQLVRPSVVYDSVFDLTLEHDEAPDVSRIDPAPSTTSVAALLELEEARRALGIALDKELESQRKIRLLQKQLESGREAQEVKQLRRELSGTKEKLEKVEAEAREKIRTLQRELALELEAKDEALNQNEVLEEKLERKHASQEEALDNMKSLRKELKKKTERLRALQQQQQQQREMTGMRDDKRVVSMEQELQTENQNVMRSLRRELERKDVTMKNLRDQLEKAKGSMGALRAEKEEARNASRQAVLRLEGELAEVTAKLKEFKEEQEAADARWQEAQVEKQAREAEIVELKRTLKSMEKLPEELHVVKARRNEAELAMFGLESEIEALKEKLEGKEKEISEARGQNNCASGDGRKPPPAPMSGGVGRRESREVRSRLSLEMDEVVAGLLVAGSSMAVSKMSLREGEEQQSVDRYKKVIMDLQEHVKKQDVWLDECEFDISKWEGRYRHEQGEHEKTERKYKEALEKADKERVVLRKEAQRLSLELERVLEEKGKLEATMKELEATAAVERKKPESRTTSSSTSMSMKSLVSYERRIVALKMETVKLKQEAEAVEASKRAAEMRAERAEKKVEFMKVQRKEFEETLEKLMKQIDVVDAERVRLLHELSSAQDELKALKTGIAGMSDYNTAIKEAMRDAQRSARSVEVEKNNSEELPHVVEMVEGSPPVIATVRSAKTKRSGGGGLSLLSVRMSELGPKGENDKENIAVVETIVEEMEAERIAQSKERQPLKPSAFQPKIIPLNPGAIPSKIGKPRNPGVIPATTPLTMFKPHRVRQLAQVFTASACAAAARSPKKKAVGIVAKPRMKNLIGLRALGRLDGGNPNGA